MFQFSLWNLEFHLTDFDSGTDNFRISPSILFVDVVVAIDQRARMHVNTHEPLHENHTVAIKSRIISRWHFGSVFDQCA